jgi:hypothetical protein
MQMDANGLLHIAQKFVYSNGQDQPPTAISLDKAVMKDLLFNQSPSKVCQALVYPLKNLYTTINEIIPFSFEPEQCLLPEPLTMKYPQ